MMVQVWESRGQMSTIKEETEAMKSEKKAVPIGTDKSKQHKAESLMMAQLSN